MIFFLPFSNVFDCCLSRCVAGAGCTAGNGRGISRCAPLDGKANSTSERRAGREALAGRLDCGWSMVDCFRR